MSEIDFNKLKEPFPAEDIEWRLQSCGKKKDGTFWGKALAYVTNRAIQNRLDEVVGPQNWKNEFSKGPDGGILCGLSIKCDGEWVTKFDGSENTQIEAVKGGLSGSMKRAASTGWGIGRYLYQLDEGWAEITENGIYSGKTKEGEWFKWNPPKLPSWALPDGKSQSKPTEVIADSDVDAMINVCLDYIADGTIKGEQADKTSGYIKERNGVKLREIINWCKKKQDKIGA